MTRKDELVAKLKDSPTDREALDNLVGFFVQRGDFQGVYDALQEVVDSFPDVGALVEFKGRLVEVLRKHIDVATDPSLAAAVRLRLARLLYDKGGGLKEALILVTEAFERVPSEEISKHALNMLNELKLSGLVTQLLRQKAATEEGSERQADTLYLLGTLALNERNVSEARWAFEQLTRKHPSWGAKAQEGLKRVEAAMQELEANIADLQKKLEEATEVEIPVLKLRLGTALVSAGRLDEGIAMLEEAMEANPSEETFMTLAQACKDSQRWEKLAELAERWGADKALSEESRKELLKERARIHALKLNNREKGYAEIDELVRRYPSDPEVIEFCAQLYAECDDYKKLADLLRKARQGTKDRQAERRYLEWEAALRWRKLGNLEEAEPLYRRIKSIDPRNEPTLVFYEEYARQKGDFKKLYTILSTRQSLVPDQQKVKILKQMAEISATKLASPDRAIDALKKILVLAPDDKEAFENLAKLLEETKRWHALIELYSSHVDRLPDSANEQKLDLLTRMRDIYASKERLPIPEMLIAVYRRILKVDPENLEAIAALAEYYQANSRWSELVEVLEARTRLETDKKKLLDLHREIARIIIECQHQEAAAIPHLEKAVELAPRDLATLTTLTHAYRARGDYEKFLEVGKKLLVQLRGSERRELLEELSTVAMERLQLNDEACNLLEKLYAAEPNHPWAFRRLLQLYTNLEKHDACADLLRRGIERAPASKKRELKEKLATLLSEKLERYDEAKAIFYELVQENPANWQVRQSLHRMLAQAGEFAELENIYRKENNIPGLLRFLDEFRHKEQDPGRAKAAGMEIVRLTDTVQKDKTRARQALESLLEQFPADPEIAAALLKFYPPEKTDMDVVRALSVIADNTQGEEAYNASVQLADVLEKIGEHEASYARTLALFLEQARNSDLSLIEVLTNRAEQAHTLEALGEVLQELIAEEGVPQATRFKLVIHAAELYRDRLKDMGKAEEILRGELARDGQSLEILQELESIYTATSNWSELERTIRSMADIVMDLNRKKEELHKLARLYEEITLELEKAESVYREIREEDPRDEEAWAGLKRTLEELEKWQELAEVLEEELQVSSDEQRRENLLALASLMHEKLSNPKQAAEYWRTVVQRWPEEEQGWEKLEGLFAVGEALAVVIPLLEERYESQQNWQSLVDVLRKKAEISEEEQEKYDTLRRCAQILRDRLGRPKEAFSYLSSMASMNPSDPELIRNLNEVGREAGLATTVADILKGLVGIGESEFVPAAPLPESLEYEASLMLATLAEELGDRSTAIEALQKARSVDSTSLELFPRLEKLLESEERWEELLELLEAKRDLVLEESDKVALYFKAADLLSLQLGREEESIPWVEELFYLTGTQEALERLENLYLRYERWTELAALLQSRLARLEGEKRRAVAYQLAIVQRDHLGDLHGAWQLLSDIFAQDPANDEYLEALFALLDMNDCEGYEGIAIKTVQLLEPAFRSRKNWERLSDVLSVKAQLASDPRESAGAWHDIAEIHERYLSAPDKAFDALCRAVECWPSYAKATDDLVASAERLGRYSEAISALEAGLGDIETTSEIGPLAVLASLLRDHSDDLPRAAVAYERLLQLSPEQLEYYWALEGIYRALDDLEGRIRVLSALAKRLDGREKAEVLVSLAELQLGQEQRLDAINSLQEVASNPDLLDPERRNFAFHLLEDALEAEERWYDLARILITRLGYIENLNEKKAILARVAQIEENRLSNPDKAIEHYFSIIDLDLMDQTASTALYRLLEGTSRFQELEELLSTQSEQTEDSGQKRTLLLSLAEVRMTKLGNGERAVDALAALIENNVHDEEVIRLLEQVVENFPDAGFRATQLLETVYTAREEWEKLAETFETQIDRYPSEVDRVERYRELATLYEEHLSDIDAAFLYMAQAFKLEPGSEVIHDKVVSYARTRGSFDELFDIYLDALAQLEHPARRNDLRRKMVAIYHDELNDFKRAEMIYRDILDDEPGDPFSLERLQALYQQQEAWDKLIDVLRIKADTASSDKERISTLFEIAEIYRERTGDLAEALDTYEQILSVDQNQWDAFRGIESIHFERGDAESVVSTLGRELALRESPEEKKEIRLRLAAILFNELTEYEQAVEEISLILQELPADEQALDLLAQIVDTWEAPSEKAVNLLVDARTAAEDWDGLVALYQKLASRGVTDEERMEWLEKIYSIRVERQNNELGAFAACKVMVLLDPSNPLHRDRLVRHAEKSGQVEDLIEFLRELLASEQVTASAVETDIQFLLGTILQDMATDKESAVSWFEQVAAGPNPDLGAKAKERLRSLYQELERFDKYVELMETFAVESHDPLVRCNCLLEAAQVAWHTLQNHEKALEILRTLSREFPEDDRVLSRYEQLLIELRKVPELEAFLRERVERTSDPLVRAEVRVKLASLIMSDPEKISAGVSELLIALDENPDLPALPTMLESLLESDETPDEDRLSIARALEKSWSTETDPAKRRKVFEIWLPLEEDTQEAWRIHLELASLLEAAGEGDEAFIHISQALKLKPGVADVEEKARNSASAHSLFQEYRDLLLELVELVEEEELRIRYLVEAATVEGSNLGSPDRAAALYRRVLELDPAHRAALAALDEYYSTTGDIENLVPILQKEVEVEGEPQVRVKLMLKLANLCLTDLKDLEQARRYWEELLHQPETRREAFAALEKVYSQEEAWDALADLLLQERDEVSGEERVILLSRLAALYEERLENVEEALHWFQELLQEDPYRSNGLLGAKRCALQLGDWQIVADMDERLLASATQEETIALFQELATIYLENLGMRDKGLTYLHKLLESPPVSAEMKSLAMSLITDPEVGTEVALALEPVLEQEEDWPALASLYQALLDGPLGQEEKHQVAIRAVDVLNNKLNDSTTAFDLLSPLISQSPSAASLLEALAALASASGDWKRYVEVLQSAWENTSDSEQLAALASLIAATYLQRLKDMEEALNWYKKILEERPADVDAVLHIEEILENLGRHDELVEFYESILPDVEGDQRIEVLLKLGFLKEGELKDPAGALETYREVLSISPTNEAAINRLDALLDNPALSLAAVEILEPVYRSSSEPKRLARLLKVKAAEVEGSLDRAQLLAEAAKLMSSVQGEETEAFNTYLEAIRQKRFDTHEILEPAEELAQQLGAWSDLANTLEEVVVDEQAGNLKFELLRRLALIYIEKLNNHSLAELKLRQILDSDPDNAFALNMLSQVLEQQGQREEQIVVLEKLGDISFEAKQKKGFYRQAAEIAVSLEQNDSAIRLFSKGLKVAPDDTELMDRLAALHRSANAWEELVNILETRSKYLPTSQAVETLLEAAHIAYFNMEAASRALAIGRLVLEKDATNRDALSLMNKILASQGKVQEQINVLERLAALQQGAALVETLWQLKDLAVRMGDLEAAVGYVQRILALDPSDARAMDAKIELLKGSDDLYRLVAAYEEQAKIAKDPERKAELLYQAAVTLADEVGDTAAALEKLSALRELKPDHVESLQKIAHILVQQQDFAKAVAAYEELAGLTQDPERRVDALKAAARIALNEMSDSETAERFATTALDVSPDDVEAFELLASALAARGQYENLARILLDRIKHTQEPSDRAALCKRLALIYRDALNREDLFLNWIEEAHRLQEDPELVDQLLVHYRKQGSLERVAPLLEWKINFLSSHKHLKEVPNLLHELGSVYAQMGDANKSLDAYRRSIQVDASFLPGIYSVAVCLFEKGAKEEALAYFQTLLLRINEMPDPAAKIDVYLKLAGIHLDKGDKKKAKTYLTRLLSLDKENKEARALLDSL